MPTSSARQRREKLNKNRDGSTISTSLSSSSDDDTSKPIATKRTWTRLLVFFLIPLLVPVAIILIGAEWERSHMERAKETSSLYSADARVCAGPDPESFRSFDTADDVPASYDIAHCGQCSQCSTMHDMTIYAGTTKTLTDGATLCSIKGFVASLFLWRGLDVYRKVASACLTEHVGFTEPCQECWLDDMECSIQACIFSCLKSVYLKREPKNFADGTLNKCLECDEKLCGPEFLRCSGSNRRRQGIQSDIARGGAEICQSVTMDWGKQGDSS